MYNTFANIGGTKIANWIFNVELIYSFASNRNCRLVSGALADFAFLSICFTFSLFLLYSFYFQYLRFSLFAKILEILKFIVFLQQHVCSYEGALPIRANYFFYICIYVHMGDLSTHYWIDWKVCPVCLLSHLAVTFHLMSMVWYI
jgi:hypothetical protein